MGSWFFETSRRADLLNGTGPPTALAVIGIGVAYTGVTFIISRGCGHGDARRDAASSWKPRGRRLTTKPFAD